MSLQELLADLIALVLGALTIDGVSLFNAVR